MHACSCGYFSDPTRGCRCTGAIIQRYLSKVSGSRLDRIDTHIEVPARQGHGRRLGRDAPIECKPHALSNRNAVSTTPASRQLRGLCALDEAGGSASVTAKYLVKPCSTAVWIAATGAEGLGRKFNIIELILQSGTSRIRNRRKRVTFSARLGIHYLSLD